MLNVAGLFVGDRPIVQAKVDKEMTAYSSEDATNVWSGPLVVLTNHRTRKMGELLAGALKDNQRALVLGEATFGDGCLSTLFELWSTSGDQADQERLGALSVTSVVFFRPSGRSIQGRGIAPHIVLPVMEHRADREERPRLVDTIVDSVVPIKSNDALGDELLIDLRTKSKLRRSNSAYFRGDSESLNAGTSDVIAGVPDDGYLKEAVAIALDYCESIQ